VRSETFMSWTTSMSDIGFSLVLMIAHPLYEREERKKAFIAYSRMRAADTMVKVREVMSSPVMSIGPDTLVKEAAAKLAENDVSGVPVVEQGMIVGIFSESDVLRSLKTTKKDMRLVFPSLSTIGIAFQEEVTQREILEAYEEIGEMAVREIMSKEVHSVSPDITLSEAIMKMVQLQINRLPVVEGEQLVGIVTRGDIIRGLAREKANNDRNSASVSRA
jgi:CBS domain-containing protein